MAFQDVINNYANGQSGTITTANGTVDYTITSSVVTATRPNTTQGAQVPGDGTGTFEVSFDNPVVGVTVKFDRSNQPEVYKVTINGQEVDIEDLINNGDATFTSVIAGSNPVQTGTHIIMDGGVTSTGAPTNNSLGFLTINIPVDSIGIYGTGGGSGTFDMIEVGVDSVTSAVVCFTADTELLTPEGPRRICDLTAGDAVITYAGQTRTIIATNVRHVRPIELFRETRLLPVRIAAGALGSGLPRCDLVVSRQHRIMVASRIARRICGQDEVLIPAFRLVGIPGIDYVRKIEPVSYHHVMLDGHDIVVANGAPAESLYLGPMSATALQDDDEDEQHETPHFAETVSMTPARHFATARESRRIVAAHVRHQRPVLELELCVTA